MVSKNDTPKNGTFKDIQRSVDISPFQCVRNTYQRYPTDYQGPDLIWRYMGIAANIEGRTAGTRCHFTYLPGRILLG